MIWNQKSCESLRENGNDDFCRFLPYKGHGGHVGHSDFKINYCFSQILLSQLEPNFISKLMGAWE